VLYPNQEVDTDALQLHEQSKTPETFQQKLGEIGADFPESFVKNLDRLIITMHPKYKRKAAKAKLAAARANGPKMGILDEVKQLQSRKFPGLSVPDQEWRPAQKYIEERNEPFMEKLPASISADDTLAELAAVAARRNRPSAEDFLGGEPSAKRSRNGDYKKEDYTGRDQGYAGRMNNGADRGRQRPQLDDKPVLYKIYDGTIQNVRDFGAFASIEGVQGRAEGEISLVTSADSRYDPRVEYNGRTDTNPFRGCQTE
jgi:ATP-dependent RNA helicase DHX8/PRP22